MRPSTAEALASEQGLDLKRPLRMIAPEDCPSQAVYISYFDDAIAVLQTASALERAALELRYLWWLVLIVIAGGWLALRVGRDRE